MSELFQNYFISHVTMVFSWVRCVFLVCCIIVRFLYLQQWNVAEVDHEENLFLRRNCLQWWYLMEAVPCHFRYYMSQIIA